MQDGNNYTRNKIVEMMFGEWILKSDGMNISIKINNRKLLITKTKNGLASIDEISTASRWENDQLLFLEKSIYYVTYADEFELIFGERNAAPAKAPGWEKKFERV
ncbi:MAG: hypothetical protein O9353_01890 [Bacteroidia bacterium]|nr:hypothetical protein [Bacteroidia bacterium]